MDVRDLVMTGFWPAIIARSAAALSTFLRSATPSPMPILMTTLSSSGIWKRFLKPNCSPSFWRIFSSNSTLSRAGTRSSGPRAAAGLLATAAALSVRACFAAFLSSLPALTICSAVCGRADFSGFFALSSLSAIDLDSRALGDAHFLALLAFAHDFESDTGRLAVLRIGQRHIRQVDRRFFGNDAPRLRRALALMPLDHIDPAHQHAIVVTAHLDDFAALALVAPGDNDDRVAFFDLSRHHSTSGASEMIFMWFFARSSRGTGPKMRVPTGSICGLISTAALRSKRMTEPSARLMSLAIRTITAFITSPFLTRPRGIASFTDTTMTSPMVAYLRLEPPSTLMHMTRRAPELSATSRLVCI